MLPRSKQISSIREFSIRIVRIFIFTLLLKIRKIGIIVNCLVKVMNVFVRDNFFWVSKQLMIVI